MISLKKTALEIRFDQIPEEFDFPSKIVKAIVGKTPSEKKIEASANIVLKELKKKVIVEPNRVVFTSEDSSRIDSNFFIDDFQKLQQVISLNKIKSKRIGYRNIYIKKNKNNFQEDLIFFKEKFYSNNQLINKAADVGITLDFNFEDTGAHFQTGPMNNKQLKTQYLEFEHFDIPDNFLFLDIDLFSNEPIQIEIQEVQRIFNSLSKKRNELISYWEELT